MAADGLGMTSTPDANRVLIFDTTLRDGEQSPGISLDPVDKVDIAVQLDRLGVDVIEAGFPIASVGDFTAVREVASANLRATVAGLSRTGLKDIDRCYEALEPAQRKRIHVFIATSELHMQKKLRMTRLQVLQEIERGVSHAASLCGDIEFSPEDGFRSDRDFLIDACQMAVDCGATTLNIPDTVGYATPFDFATLIELIGARVRGDYVISTHCHDDLGLAVANSLAGVRAGARQVECAINGLGERAGNAALEEIVMAIGVRSDVLGVHTGVNTSELLRTSKLVAGRTGYPVQFNKAVVGRNAFAHESGIHQHGVLADRETYEIIDARTVGQQAAQLVLGKHSGRHAFAAALAELGISLQAEALTAAFARFKELADRKVEIGQADLEAIAQESGFEVPHRYQFLSCSFNGGSEDLPQAVVTLIDDHGLAGSEIVEASSAGSGVVDAACKAVAKATGFQGELVDYRVDAISGGLDSLGKVTVTIRQDGLEATGRGVANDVVEASARAFLDAVERLDRRHSRDVVVGP